WETASRTEASHPPQLIPWTTNSLVCIPMLLSDILATVPYTPIEYISMDGVLGILPFQDGHREGSQCEMTFVQGDLCRSGTVQRCVFTIGALMNKLTLMTRLTLGAAVGALALTSCAGTGDDETAPESTPTQDQAQTDTSSPDAQAHDHDPDGGPPPSG